MTNGTNCCTNHLSCLQHDVSAAVQQWLVQMCCNCTQSYRDQICTRSVLNQTMAHCNRSRPCAKYVVDAKVGQNQKRTEVGHTAASHQPAASASDHHAASVSASCAPWHAPWHAPCMLALREEALPQPFYQNKPHPIHIMLMLRSLQHYADGLCCMPSQYKGDHSDRSGYQLGVLLSIAKGYSSMLCYSAEFMRLNR